MPDYQNMFFKLLRKYFDISSRGEDFLSYVTYLWEIIIKYIDNLKEKRSYCYLIQLEKEIQKEYLSKEGINWFQYKVKELKNSYINYIGKPNHISDCIKTYNYLKSIQYLKVGNPKDLVDLVLDILRNDIKKWIEDEGFYRVINEAKGTQEKLIQKIIKIQLENCLLKRGFRKNEIDIRREEQLLDDKKTDILISYGFIQPVLIELKRIDNDEVTCENKRQEYKQKFYLILPDIVLFMGYIFCFKSMKHIP
jgi:hypothetical protein